jgi:hypothetical protein
MKQILIKDYPADMLFKVKNELPEFTYSCPVRNKILHRQIRNEIMVEQLSHYVNQYIVESIEVTEQGNEIWYIGS